MFLDFQLPGLGDNLDLRLPAPRSRAGQPCSQTLSSQDEETTTFMPKTPTFSNKGMLTFHIHKLKLERIIVTVYIAEGAVKSVQMASPWEFDSFLHLKT